MVVGFNPSHPVSPVYMDARSVFDRVYKIGYESVGGVGCEDPLPENRGFRFLPEKQVFGCMPEERGFQVVTQHAHSGVCRGSIGLLLVVKSIVAWGVWVPMVKLMEFFQTTQGELVERLLRSVLSIREVKPLDEIEDPVIISASSLDT
jgi:hypothetical protein